MSNIKKSLNMGSKIKRARKETGLSQKELARLLGVSDKAVSSYEVGRAQPPITTLKEISNVTYKPVSYFMEEEAMEDVDVAGKIDRIEHELSEIKKILAARQLQQIEVEQTETPDE